MRALTVGPHDVTAPIRNELYTLLDITTPCDHLVRGLQDVMWRECLYCHLQHCLDGIECPPERKAS